MRPGHVPNLGQNGFPLLSEDIRLCEIVDFAQHCTLHDRAAFVIFDVPGPYRPIECDFLGEALLFEVPDGIVVCVGEKVHHAWVCDGNVVFEVIH